jgi:hypothetical protein
MKGRQKALWMPAEFTRVIRKDFKQCEPLRGIATAVRQCSRISPRFEICDRSISICGISIFTSRTKERPASYPLRDSSQHPRTFRDGVSRDSSRFRRASVVTEQRPLRRIVPGIGRLCGVVSFSAARRGRPLSVWPCGNSSERSIDF